MTPDQHSANGSSVTNNYQTHSVDEEIMDFTEARKQIQFRIDSDIFQAHPALPALTLLDFGARVRAIDTDDEEAAKEQIVKSLELVLKAESQALFVSRMRDFDVPIDINQVNRVIPWLMEQYGLRPTQPSSGSSNGESSPVDGTSSTENTPDVVSISSGSL